MEKKVTNAILTKFSENAYKKHYINTNLIALKSDKTVIKHITSMFYPGYKYKEMNMMFVINKLMVLYKCLRNILQALMIGQYSDMEVIA
jgi:hypothetical protein